MVEEEEEPISWKQELAGLVVYNGSTTSMNVVDDGDGRDVKESMREFFKGICEMGFDVGRSFCEIVKQSLGDDDSFVVKNIVKPLKKVCGKLSFLNEYLPEDKDPFHSWSVIFAVVFIVLAVLSLSINPATEPSIPMVKKVHLHPPNASRILLPDGRHLAYEERGVPADVARYSMILPHTFLSSRLAGIPGLKDSLLEEFGIRLISYDLPGFGESDPHPGRTLESSAFDMSHLAEAVGVGSKFWILGYSSGCIHVWAVLRYIPEKLAGVAMFAPMVSPYDPSMTKEERVKTWEKWTQKRKLVYFLARRFPKLLGYLYHRNFFSGKPGPIDKWMFLSLGKKDRLLIEEPRFKEFWERNVEESIRQGNVRPFVEETVLQASKWNFRIADIQTRKRRASTTILDWLKSMYNPAEEELTGFIGPIHIWQGMDDRVVPPSMISYVHRVLPGATVHMLPNDGHFTYLYFCDECHSQMLSTLLGMPQRPLQSTAVLNLDSTTSEDTEEFAPENPTTD